MTVTLRKPATRPNAKAGPGPGADPERPSARRTAEDAVADRVLWLATRMIHEANAVRPNLDGLKVGGHQASSASLVPILCALYLRWLRADDLVAVKPHASPVYHALQYLLGGLDASYLTRLRSFGGLQSYASRTKDPDRVDFSTGSVGLGAVAPLFAALTDRYLDLHRFGPESGRPDRRFVALVGDAELDEGSIWEAALEESLSGLGNVTMIVDLNRQSLDRVVPGIRTGQLEGMFRAAGWQVLEVKYGRRLHDLFGRPGGELLRTAIDDMSNETYQSLIRQPGPAIRERLVGDVAPGSRDGLAAVIADVGDEDLPATLSDLGGHDIDEIVRALDAADADRARPSVVFAYTIKGWGLPFAGDPSNHSAHLTAPQLETLADRLGVDPAAPWDAFPADSDEGRLCAERGRALRLTTDRTPAAARWPGWQPPSLDVRIAARTSTQTAFGDAMAALARVPEVGPRVVTASPDVAVSTSLGGWVNRVGVFAQAATEAPETPGLLRWVPGPDGRHIELGISEMNLFMWLSQAGLSAELFEEPLVPVGTVYDPFICRGLDALVYALYVRSRFILVGTPSGVTLAPEGGAHQSAITTSIGIELPGLHTYEPAFAREVVWILEEGLRGVLDPGADFSTYLRLSTRPVDQALAERVRARHGDDGWRRALLAGGYRLFDDQDDAASRPPAGAPRVDIVAVGSVVTEAATAVEILRAEEVDAELVVVTSADRLSAEVHDRRLAGVRARRGGDLGHLDELFPAHRRRAPMVTVLDGASHALGFLGGVHGAPVVPLGVDTFGQSGTIDDLYRAAGIATDDIIDGALLAIELAGDQS